MEKLIAGAVQFRGAPYEERKALFAELANGQSPEVMMITCSDSRVCPNLITQTEPGDIFVIENAGNIVPPHTQNAEGVTASIEFAVAALGVQHIVVCGHSDCGAMKGAMYPGALTDLPHVKYWLTHSRGAVDAVHAKHGDAHDMLEQVTQENVVQQLQHLRTHPAVLSKLATGDLELHGWVYTIEHGTIVAYDEASGSFNPVEEQYRARSRRLH